MTQETAESRIAEVAAPEDAKAPDLQEETVSAEQTATQTSEAVQTEYAGAPFFETSGEEDLTVLKTAAESPAGATWQPSESLKKWAADLGLEENYLSLFRDESSAREGLASIHAEILRGLAATTPPAQPVYPQPPAIPPYPQIPQAPQPPQTGTAQRELSRIKVPDDIDDYPPAFKQLLEQHNRLIDEIEAMRSSQEHAEILNRQQYVLSLNSTATRLYNELEDWFRNLDGPMAELFGTEPTASLPQDSPQYRNRVRLLEDGLGILNHVAAASRLGRSPAQMPPAGEIAQRAAYMVFGKELEGALRRKIGNELRERYRTAAPRVRRSTGGKPTALSTEEEVEIIRNKMIEKGFPI